MTTPVRPTGLPAAAQAQPPAHADVAKTAAQRAFFQAALGGAAPSKPAAEPAQPPAVYAQPVQRMPDPAAEPPTRILRPGSLLDIRV